MKTVIVIFHTSKQSIMSNIIIPENFAGRIGNNDKDQQKFSIELMGGKTVDVIYNGKPEMLIQMLFNTMQAHEHIAHTLITAVIIFADQKKIPINKLKEHSFFNKNIK